MTSLKSLLKPTFLDLLIQCYVVVVFYYYFNSYIFIILLHFFSLSAESFGFTIYDLTVDR